MLCYSGRNIPDTQTNNGQIVLIQASKGMIFECTTYTSEIFKNQDKIPSTIGSLIEDAFPLVLS